MYVVSDDSEYILRKIDLTIAAIANDVLTAQVWLDALLRSEESFVQKIEMMQSCFTIQYY